MSVQNRTTVCIYTDAQMQEVLNKIEKLQVDLELMQASAKVNLQRAEEAEALLQRCLPELAENSIFDSIVKLRNDIKECLKK